MAHENITGAHKVAAFLLSIDREKTSEVLRHLDQEVLDSVAEAMTELDGDLCSSEAVSRLYKELAGAAERKGDVRPTTERQLCVLLEDALGAERAEQVLKTIQARRTQENPFEFLEHEPSDRTHALLADESPGMAALILAYLDPNKSAEVMGHMDPDDALEIVIRIASLHPPGSDALGSIADTLRQKLVALRNLPQAPDKQGSLKTIAEMLNFAGQEIEQTVLDGIEQEDEEMAAGIRDFMFTWGDLATVDKRSMQKILATVDTRTLAISLKGSSPEVEANIINNLSSRVQEMVVDERDLAGAMPMQEVQAARAEVLKGVRSLMDSGEFRPVRAGEELVS